MMNALAVTDLHGNSRLYELLLRIAALWKISSVFIAGDLAPSTTDPAGISALDIDASIDRQKTFLAATLIPMLDTFLARHRHTHVYAIMGNDDRRANEPLIEEFSDATRNFHLVTDRLIEFEDAKQIRTFFPDEVPALFVAGYPYVPPGSGALTDWVKHENRVGLVPPGMDPCIDLRTWGVRTADHDSDSTIHDDLSDFAVYLENPSSAPDSSYDPRRTIHLFHAPPYNTPLDQTAPQGQIDSLRLPDHIGSTEIRRFIERAQPYLFLCGHCHEAVVMGDYRTDLGQSRCVNPGSQAHIDVLSLVQFDPYQLSEMKQFFIHAD